MIESEATWNSGKATEEEGSDGVSERKQVEGVDEAIVQV